jgi:hypothetical protein
VFYTLWTSSLFLSFHIFTWHVVFCRDEPSISSCSNSVISRDNHDVIGVSDILMDVVPQMSVTFWVFIAASLRCRRERSICFILLSTPQNLTLGCALQRKTWLGAVIYWAESDTAQCYTGHNMILHSDLQDRIWPCTLIYRADSALWSTGQNLTPHSYLQGWLCFVKGRIWFCTVVYQAEFYFELAFLF